MGGGYLARRVIPELKQEENLELAIYVENERQSTIPEKENANNYVFDKATCFVNGKEDASVTISWDSEAWGPVVKGLTTYKTRCDLYFKEETDLDRCYKQYGEDSIQCGILAEADDTGKCPEVNEDGTVEATSTEKTNGYLCSAPDDYGASYYYRGNVENNWVKFANTYWRILRINGDGSIRMIYAGDASVIDALDNKEEVLKNGYDDSTTKYTQIGESPYNEYWKKDNVQESVNSVVSADNAGVGYMYGNRDGIVEGSNAINERSQNPTSVYYYASSYNYDVTKDRFTMNNPIAVSGTEVSTELIGKYTFLNSSPNRSAQFIYKVIEVTPSDGTSTAKIGISDVRYGTTSKEKAQTNTNDSTIKEYVDEWYENHIKGTEYERYLSDTLFCNDRNLSPNMSSGDSQLGYGTESTSYNGDDIPARNSLICEQKNDRFTVHDEIVGNGDLTYPIGLFTVGEGILAGGSNTNTNYYLYTGNSYWTMTPRYVKYGNSFLYLVQSDGNFTGSTNSSSSKGIRPVINLKPNSLNTGDGTASNPYRIE